jgi:molybdate transport system ATP-binding protein
MSLKIDCLLERNNFRLDVQLEAKPRSVLAITGENGSGKTSTLDMISGLLACTKGKILSNDKVFDDAATGEFLQPEFRGVATVFQGGNLFNHLSVTRNITFGRGVAFKDTSRFNEVVAQFNLESLLSHKPSTLSGGQRQRVALARAFLAPSEVLLLDEPTTSLDIDSREGVIKTMQDFFKTYGGVVILVSHDVAEVAELATQVAKIEVSRGKTTEAKLRVQSSRVEP